MPVAAIGVFVGQLIAGAELIGSAIGVTLGGAVGAASIGGAIGATVADVALDGVALFALSTASELLQGKPPIGGTQVDFIADPQSGVPYAIGRTGTGGKIVMTDSAGTNSAFLTYVSVLSLGPIQAYESFQANTILTQFDADNDEGAGHQTPTTTALQPVTAGATTIQVGTTNGFGTSAGTGVSSTITISGGGNSETRTLTRVDQSPKELTWSGGLSHSYPIYAEVTGASETSGFKNRMWLKTQLGGADAPYLTFTSTDSKDTPANHSGIPTVWTSNCQLSGLAATFWTLEYDAQVYSGGTPRPLHVIQGVLCYDPRLDSTYPGGSGSCRSNNEATWVYSQNPFVHALTWLIGRTSNGVKTMGVHAPLAALDIPAFVIGMNVADANGWTLGGVIMSTDSKWDVLTYMLQAGGGTPLKLGAKISCMVNTPLVSLDTLTGADVVGKASIANTTPSRDRINAVWPRYREEQQGWQIVPTQTPVIVSAYVTADGGQRTRETEYTLVQDANQVAQLARYDIENAREIQPISLPCKPRWMGYKPGDCITINEPEYGLASQTVLITSREVDPATLTTTLGFRTETTAKHAFALGQTGTAPVTPTMNGFDPSVFAAPLAASWGATGTLLESSAGSLPAINVVGAIDNAMAASIITEFSPAGEDIWSTFGEAPPATTLIQITGLAPGANYDVQLRYRSVKGVVSDPTVITPAGGVVTGGISSRWSALIGTPTNLADLAGTEAILNSQVAIGSNYLANSDWVTDTTGWEFYGATSITTSGASSGGGRNYTGYFGARNVLFSYINAPTDLTPNAYFFGPASAGFEGTLSNLLTYGLPVDPGDLVAIRALMVAYGASLGFVRIRWFGPTGALVQENDYGAAGLVDARRGGLAGGGGLESNYYPAQGICAAPSGAAFASFGTYAYTASGAGLQDPTLYIFMMEPMLAKLAPGSTVVPPYTPGPAVRNATVGAVSGVNLSSPTYGALADTQIYTPIGISAGIAEQGLLATQNSANVTAGQIYSSTYGLLYEGSIYTPLGIAAGISGQGTGATTNVGALATQNLVTYGSAYVAGFGVIAGLNYITTNSSQLYSSTYGYLYDGQIYTPVGIAAGIAGQKSGATTTVGALATQDYVVTGITGNSGDYTGLYSPTYGWLSDTGIFTPIGVASGIAAQGTQATANTYVQPTDPAASAAVPNGSFWANTASSPNCVLYIRVSGGWSQVANFTTSGGASAGYLASPSPGTTTTIGNSGWTTLATLAFTSVASVAYWTQEMASFLNTAIGSTPLSTGSTTTVNWRIVEAPHGTSTYTVIANGSFTGNYVSDEGVSFPSGSGSSVIDLVGSASPVKCHNSGAVDVLFQAELSSPASMSSNQVVFSAGWLIGG